MILQAPTAVSKEFLLMHRWNKSRSTSEFNALEKGLRSTLPDLQGGGPGIRPTAPETLEKVQRDLLTPGTALV